MSKILSVIKTLSTEFDIGDFHGTYSPEDNKLRIRSESWLGKELFLAVKEAGFKWAPKQELFVAPMWTPLREDVVIELCGEVCDEHTTKEERAIERSNRFSGYQENRLSDANSAYDAVSALTDNIPFGQPILVGHHSEKRARKMAEKIDNGMKKAVSLFDTSEYWERRVNGVIRHASYGDNPTVRARRIKKLKASFRKKCKELDSSLNIVLAYQDTNLSDKLIDKMLICFGVSTNLVRSDYENGLCTRAEAVARCVSVYKGQTDFNDRWATHYNLRINYETKLLSAQNAMHLIEPIKRPKSPPLLNYIAKNQLKVIARYGLKEFDHYKQITMTKENYNNIYSDHRFTVTVKTETGSHRVRAMIMTQNHKYTRLCVFLSDSKVHPAPE